MRKSTTALVAAIAAAFMNAGAASATTYVLRSPSTGTIPTAVTAPVTPPVTVPPEIPVTPPTGILLSYAGATSVAVGTEVDLRPIVSGASGSLSYLIAGSVPAGVNFRSSTGVFSGRALVRGRFEVAVMAMDAAGVPVSTMVVFVVS